MDPASHCPKLIPLMSANARSRVGLKMPESMGRGTTHLSGTTMSRALEQRTAVVSPTAECLSRSRMSAAVFQRHSCILIGNG